jgi:hypothetical protein
MISFDIACSHGHVFEVWFRSSGDYAEQQARGLIACAVCGDTAVSKAVMAPNIGAKGNRSLPVAVSASPAEDSSATPSPPALSSMSRELVQKLPPEAVAALAMVAKVQADMLPKSKWVGKNFAAEARAQAAAEDDIPATPIHGQATAEEAEALIDDGIAIMPLLVPIIPPDMQN